MTEPFPLPRLDDTPSSAARADAVGRERVLRAAIRLHRIHESWATQLVTHRWQDCYDCQVKALAALEAAESGDELCTGITAYWCPIHGSCSCPPCDGPSDERTMDDPGCPLHAADSLHGELVRG